MTTTISGVLPLLAFVAFAPGIVWRGRRRATPGATIVAQLLLAAWVAALIALTLFPLPWRTGPGRPLVTTDPRGWPLPWASIVPFATIGPSLAQGFGSAMGRVLIGNLVAFAPLGVLAPVVDRRWTSWVRVLLLGLAVSTAVELGQLAWDLVIGMPWRSADIDDVIVNAAGTLVGYGIWRLATAVRRRPFVSAA